MATIPREPEQRVVLHNVSWKTYESLLADHAESSAPRFTYDQGTLEIMSPLDRHEKLNRSLNLLVEVIAEEWGIDTENLGSSTFKREDLKRGFEPDSCFYIQNSESVHGKEQLDLNVDPPPDLVIEIDITHSSLDKLPIYAALAIREVWRHDGQQLRILALENAGYQEREESGVLPGITAATLTDLIQASTTLRRTAWLRRIREWARVHRAGPSDRRGAVED